MNKKEIQAFRKEMKLRPYKRELREIMAMIRTLGANLLIVVPILFSGWLVMVAIG